MPKWKSRRWILLKKFLANPSVKKEMLPYAKFAEDVIIPLKFYGIMAEHGLPPECWDAVTHKLKNPNATDEELMERIESPVEYISNFYKVRGPAKDVGARYNEERWKIERKIEVYGTDRAPEDTSVYIKVSPFTSITEVQSFIKDQWQDIQLLLEKTNNESDGTFDPVLLKSGATRLRDRGKREEVDAFIVEQHTQGSKSPQIRDLVHDKYGIWIDEANIRKIVSRSRI